MADLQKAHSKIGASSAERWFACPGSVRLCGTVPPSASSKYAEEGTRAHDVAAHRLTTGQYPKDVDQEMQEAVDIYVTHVEELWRSVPRNDRSKIFIEQKFDLSEVYPGLFGTADCVIYDAENETMYVLDYKHGQGKLVEAEGNLQLMYYALGAKKALGLPVKLVDMRIVQPRYMGADKIKYALLTAGELGDFTIDLKKAAMQTAKADAPFKSGDHCQWCPARAVCPELGKARELAVKAQFQLEALPKLPSVQLGELLDQLPVLETWIKGVREFAYTEAQSGRTPSGYKLVPKRAIRKWTDIEAATKRFERSLSASMFRECLTDPELKSPAQMEKVLKGIDAIELVEELCTAISSGDTLVPSTDSRLPSTNGARTAFKNSAWE